MAQLSSTCWVIFGSLIIDLLAFTVILPLMPSIFDYYANNDHVSRVRTTGIPVLIIIFSSFRVKFMFGWKVKCS